MAQSEWINIFRIKASNLKPGDIWHLEFDNKIMPDCPNQGWAQYIRNTSARFRCTKCRRSWPSNRVMVVFHMHLINGMGTVKVRACRQNCKMCTAAPMEEPEISVDNISILLDNLIEKIRIKCYHEKQNTSNKPSHKLDVKSPHEPSHCEACIEGICERNTAASYSAFY
ncbi:receptor-transporting protein 3-like [Mastacembelus armatus]|uniref:Receptor-transporting protein 3-like n=1 Tax=Mastacembelus armatus TaxID=205130 RepID=A0A3Q3RIA6_9TELE|nr:receptor-transporting protein 3-like [Mastacembelus armatus]